MCIGWASSKNESGLSNEEVIIYRTPASVVAEVRKCEVNKVGDCRKGKDSYVAKVVEHCLREPDFPPASIVGHIYTMRRGVLAGMALRMPLPPVPADMLPIQK